MLDTLLIILNCAPTECRLVNDFSNVLENEVIFVKIRVGT